MAPTFRPIGYGYGNGYGDGYGNGYGDGYGDGDGYGYGYGYGNGNGDGYGYGNGNGNGDGYGNGDGNGYGNGNGNGNGTVNSSLRSRVRCRAAPAAGGRAMSDRIIKMADERGEFQYLEDGFLYYWPSGGGAISAEQLRLLACELDRRNAKWAAEIEDYFSKQETRGESHLRPDRRTNVAERLFGDE